MGPMMEAAFTRRVAPGVALTDAAEQVGRACGDMAERFRRGGRLMTFGNGEAAADAAHLAVEFLHPVLVGKRALPAVSLGNDPAALTGIGHADGYEQTFAAQLRVLGRPDDIAIGICVEPPSRDVLHTLAEARRLGMLTVALTPSDPARPPEPDGDSGTAGPPEAAGPARIADHVLRARTDDPRIAKEIHVTTYHVLWELVHVFLDQSPLAPEVPR